MFGHCVIKMSILQAGFIIICSLLLHLFFLLTLHVKHLHGPQVLCLVSSADKWAQMVSTVEGPASSGGLGLVGQGMDS